MSIETLDTDNLQDEYDVIDTSCPTCGGEGKQFEDCSECGGTGANPCSVCDGDCEVGCFACAPHSKGYLEDGSECIECGGTGKIDCDACLGTGDEECGECEGTGEVGADCPTCEGGGDFEIMWNDAYRIYESQMKYSADGDARKVAWENGFLLFEYNSKYWLAAGGCGYDFSWELAWCVYSLCGYLPFDYAEELRGGGYCFVTKEQANILRTEAANKLEVRAQSMLRESKQYRKDVAPERVPAKRNHIASVVVVPNANTHKVSIDIDRQNEWRRTYSRERDIERIVRVLNGPNYTREIRIGKVSGAPFTFCEPVKED